MPIDVEWLWDLQVVVIIEISTKIDEVMVFSKLPRGTISSIVCHLDVVVCTFIDDPGFYLIKSTQVLVFPLGFFSGFLPTIFCANVFGFNFYSFAVMFG